MKKITIQTTSSWIIYIIYITFLVLQYSFKIFEVDFKDIWFPAFMLAMGLSLFIKFIIFKRESILWFSLIFLAYFVICVSYIGNTDYLYSKLWPVFLVIPGMCSILLAFPFKDTLQARIGILILSFTFPFVLWIVLDITFWKSVLIGGGVILLGIILERHLYKKASITKQTND